MLLSHALECEGAAEFVVALGERRVFVDEFVDGDTEFVFLAFVFAGEVEFHHGIRINNGLDGDVTGGTEGIVCLGVLQFCDGNDVTEDALFEGIAVVSTERVERAETFGLATASVDGTVVGGNFTGKDAEDVLFAGEFIDEGANDEGFEWAVGIAFHRVVGAVADDFDIGVLERRGAVFDDHVEEHFNADEVEGRGIEDGDEFAALDGRRHGVDALFMRKFHRVEVFHHEIVVGFCDGFHNGFPGFLDSIGVFCGDVTGFVFAGISVERVGFVVENRNNALERIGGAHRNLELDGADFELFFDVGEALCGVRTFLVHFVDDDHLGETEFFGFRESTFGLDFDAVGGGNDDDGHIGAAHSGEGVINEVAITRSVDDVDFFASVFAPGKGCCIGTTAFDFFGFKVESGRTGYGRAKARRHTRLEKDCFTKCSLSAGTMANERDVTDVTGIKKSFSHAQSPGINKKDSALTKCG